MKKRLSNKTLILVLLLTFSAFLVNAQDEGGQEIDASKPTNFYTQLINNLEFISRPMGGNLLGYRAEIVYAPSEAHLILGEIPLLYNDGTKKFGLGDIRARYFWLPYKNYDKFFGAFGPSVDLFFPTGNFENGLGSSSFVVVPGVTVGLMAADWIQFFPILSYQYRGKPTTDAIPEAQKEVKHGITFQIITPIVFGPKFFMQVTPIYQANNLGDEREDRYVQEVFAQYALKTKLQLSGFFRGNFQDDIYSFRVGLVVFL